MNEPNEKWEIRYFDPEDERDVDCTIKMYRYLRKMDGEIRARGIEKINESQIMVQKLKTVKIDFILRQIASGEYAAEKGMIEGEVLKKIELDTKYSVTSMEDANLSDQGQFDQMVDSAREIFGLLVDYFYDLNMIVVNGEMWFAKDEFNTFYLASDITPETFEFWDLNTKSPIANKDEIYKKILE